MVSVLASSPPWTAIQTDLEALKERQRLGWTVFQTRVSHIVRLSHLADQSPGFDGDFRECSSKVSGRWPSSFLLKL